MPNYVWRHTYDPEKDYIVGDLVFNNGDSYICRANNKGTSVNDVSIWRLINRWAAPVISKSVEAQTLIPRGRCVSLGSDGRLVVADRSGERPVFGIAVDKIEPDTAGIVTTFGYMEQTTWSFIPGRTLYLGANGQLVYPVPQTDIIYSIGTSLSETALYINIHIPVQ